jgi:hypothetical protein
MMSDRTFAVAAVSAIIAVSVAATPALSQIGRSPESRASALSAIVGRFTPAVGDPALLRRYAALSQETRDNFRFTPALARSENRSVTLVVRAPSRIAAPTGLVTPLEAATQRGAPPIVITPVAYRLGSAVGYSAFASNISRDTVDIASLPQARRPVDPTVRPSRLSADMRLDIRESPAASDLSVDRENNYSVDLSGSYRVSRNVNVTAGVRLQGENQRLTPLTDQRQDSQAVYVGTQFRF